MKWIRDINFKGKNIKLLEGNMGENLCDVELGQSTINKRKVGKLEFNQMKYLCALKDRIQKA